jgi:hypothetical protein
MVVFMLLNDEASFVYDELLEIKLNVLKIG